MFENRIISGIEKAIEKLNGKLKLGGMQVWKYANTIIPVDQIDEWSPMHSYFKTDVNMQTGAYVIGLTGADSAHIEIPLDEEWEIRWIYREVTTASCNIVVYYRDVSGVWQGVTLYMGTTVFYQAITLRMRNGDKLYVSGSANAGDSSKDFSFVYTKRKIRA